jgi:molybdate transport system ATP-binding protein
MTPPQPQRPDPPDRPLLILEKATAVRPGGGFGLRDLTWTVREGETWAVVGRVGSGKTTLTDVLLGRLPLRSGTIAWPLLDRLRGAGRPVAWPADVLRRVSFKEDSWLFSYGRHYYQQRFNFIEPRDDLTLEAFLVFGTSVEAEDCQRMARRLGIADLLPLSLIELSNGQTRRARIARALLARPEWLILDDPFMGLDVAGRADLVDLLGGLVQQGTRVLLVTRPDAIPGWVTHVLELDHLAARWQGLRSEYQPGLAPQTPSSAMPLSRTSTTAEPIVELHGVTVRYGERPILQDVNWTVRAGERWALLGPNGSGKTTLLSLVCGDHPQAYANDVRLFGRRRGTGETIWDVKRRIGLVSPELHLYFSEPLTAFQAAATGFHDIMALRPITSDQESALRELFAHFGVAELADCQFAQLSTGEQRLILLVRALVKEPPLLVLDEPFQGLDETAIVQAKDWLDKRLRPDQTLLFVSHLADEIPRTVSRRLHLEAGQAVEMP